MCITSDMIEQAKPVIKSTDALDEITRGICALKAVADQVPGSGALPVYKVLSHLTDALELTPGDRLRAWHLRCAEDFLQEAKAFIDRPTGDYKPTTYQAMIDRALEVFDHLASGQQQHAFDLLQCMAGSANSFYMFERIEGRIHPNWQNPVDHFHRVRADVDLNQSFGDTTNSLARKTADAARRVLKFLDRMLGAENGA